MFTFIIPCFDNNTFLRAALTSIKWQAEYNHPFEIIIVDNNSRNENPDEIYKEFFDYLPIFLVKQPKLPHTFALSKARNIALHLARHPWIISLDADIVIHKNYLNNLLKIIERHHNIIIAAERIFIDGSEAHKITAEGHAWPEKQKSIKSSSNYFLTLDRRLPAMRNIETTLHPWAFMHGSNVIFPRELALQVGGYDETYDGHWGYEDIDFAYRLITEKLTQPFYGEGLHCYHLEIPVAQENISERFDKQNNPNWTRICQRIPGFKDYKEAEYQNISKLIKT